MSSQIIATNTTTILGRSEIHATAPSAGNYQTDDQYPESLSRQAIISGLAKNIILPSNKTLQETHNQSSSNLSALILSSSVSNVNKMNVTSNLTGLNTTNMSGPGNTTSSKPDPWFEMPPLENVTDLISILSSGAVIIGGLVPYIPQYLKIKKSGISEGFSTYVCLTLLIANLLRIAFWFGHRFELPLLVQSFVMIAGMVAMMELCVRVKARNAPFIIGLRSNASRPRRSIIGKILPDVNDSADVSYGLHNESTPIYSMNAESRPSSTSSTPTSNIASSASALNMSEAQHQASSYHLQESIQIEHEIMDAVVKHAEPTTQYNSNRTDSFSNLESPILSNIQQSLTSQDIQQQQEANGTGSQLADHSYSNRYLSNQRKYRPGLVKSLDSRRFWDWDDLLSYFKFLTLFTVILALITYLLVDNYYFVETLGFAAVITESMLGVPQLMRNYFHKSTQGMSVEMVIMWLSGDLFKTLYFVLRKTPVQFIICGAVQVTVDVLILIQVFWYARPKVTYSKLPKST